MRPRRRHACRSLRRWVVQIGRRPSLVIGWLAGMSIALLNATPAAADNCGVFTDCFGASSSAADATFGLALLAGLSLLLDFVPIVGDVKGLIEAGTGRDLLTGQELSPLERALGLIPLLPLSDAARAAGKVDDVIDLGRAVDRSSDVGRSIDGVPASPARGADEGASAGRGSGGEAPPRRGGAGGGPPRDGGGPPRSGGGSGPTQPSREPGDHTPGGRPQAIDPKQDDAVRRSLQRENDSAEILARHGYDVEHQPRIPETVKNPDYLIEGRVFDNYAPARTTSPRNISSSIANKVKSGQTSRIVLNLDDSAVDLNALRKQFDDYPIPGLDEVIVIRDGAVIPFFP